MSRRHGTDLHSRARIVALLACACCWSVQAVAAGPTEVPLYTVQVPVAGNTAADRSAGFKQALSAVAVRASGRQEAANNATVTGADPSRYVQRYATSSDGNLSVGFDERSIWDLLQQAGLPFWAAERPLTVIEAPGADRGQGESVAQWRGLPVQWTDAAAPADGGAGRASLVGVASGAGYDWTFTHAGQTVQGRGSVADGINLAADTLAARYAPPSTRGISTVSVSVAGIEDLGSYAGLLSFLADLSIVQDASVGELDGDRVRVDVTMRGDRQLLERLGAMDGHLVPGSDSAAGNGPGADLIYLP
jgi:hypothetical protein